MIGRHATRTAAILTAVVGLTTACASTPHGDVDVLLGDYTIAIPDQVTLDDNGALLMEVSVDGRAHHNLTICRSEDVDTCHGSDPVMQRFVRKPAQARDVSAVPDATTAVVLGDGWDATLSVDLTPGRYRVYCGIVGHAAKGMQALIDVVAAPA